MTQIQALSKYSDLSNSFKLYYVLAIGGFISIFSFAVYRSFVVALTMAVSTIIVYVVLARKPENIVIATNQAGIAFDGNVFEWSDCVAWAAVEMEGATEFILQTDTVQQRFIYFYANPEQPGISEFLQDISENLQYDETLSIKNVSHNLLRRFGLL